ncbi:FabD/lysophospholipase-like protein [Mycena venus]|uniref:FabD/lysophospholipase-like protein n=1 Tax=Mycena venus TaxID=2733690 RepID=A0A8H7CFP6_9AGAR|nr:FabD/lysophospholipase-like protein [Mycena venus]
MSSQLDGIMSSCDSQPLYIIGGQGGPGGQGHSHGTGGPGGAGLGPTVHIIAQQLIADNLYATLASDQAGQSSNIHASQTVNQCPPPSRIFQGRQDILDKMRCFFTSNLRIQHIYVLHGLGGTGKTQIALKFIQESSSHFTNIFFLDSSSIDTIGAWLKNIATTKNVGSSSQDALQWLQSNDKWLLFFDNADDPKLNLNNFLPQCDHGNILITTRNPGLYAVALLLRSAAQCPTDDNKRTATQIVKMLHYLPLAIIQAGAFISKSGDMDGYLTLYEHNQARLLSQKPAQSHDSYSWTVYTTWQINFEKLSQPAVTLLQLCSFLHYQGISEQIFKNAANYKFGPSSPSKDELKMALEFLSQFSGPTGIWDSFCFLDVTNEIQAYSLMKFDSGRKMFSMHPLVHNWIRSTLPNEESYHCCTFGIVGMSLTGLSVEDQRLAALWMQPHIDFLLHGTKDLNLNFRYEYAKIYAFGGRLNTAAELLEGMLLERRDHLGGQHLDTLEVMYWLGWVYESQGNYHEAKAIQVVELQQRRTLFGNDHPDTVEIMGKLALTYHRLGELKAAEELATELLSMKINLGTSHPDMLENLAQACHFLGKLEQTEELQLMALEKRRNVLVDNHPSILQIMGNLAITYQLLGKLKDAEELQFVTLEKKRKSLG